MAPRSATASLSVLTNHFPFPLSVVSTLETFLKVIVKSSPTLRWNWAAIRWRLGESKLGPGM